VPSATGTLQLHGWRLLEHDGAQPLDVYGSDAPALLALCSERPEWARPLHPSLPYLAGEAVWAARHEAARCVADVLARRTRALFLDARASGEAAATVAALLAQELDRSAAWQADQAAEFKKLAASYLP
jgi:glycerol-3-phosphate dehydrogenase